MTDDGNVLDLSGLDLNESGNAIIAWSAVKETHKDCRLGEFCLFKSEIVDLNRARAVEALMNPKYQPMINSLFGELLANTEKQCLDRGWTVDNIKNDQGYLRNCFPSFALAFERLTRFDSWLGSSLVQWRSLQDMLKQAQHCALEVTFDMNIMTFFNQAMILHNCLPIWRERKSMASARERESGTKDKKIDCTVLLEVCDREFEVMLFESSLCIGNRSAHRDQDRVKLCHAVACATRDMLKLHPDVDTGCVGLQLYQEEHHAIKFRGFQCRLNRTHNCWEMHQLFDVDVPLNNKDEGGGLERSLACLKHMYALASMVQRLKENLNTSCGQSKRHISSVSHDMIEEDEDGVGGSGHALPAPPASLPRIVAIKTPSKGSVPLNEAIASHYVLGQWENGSESPLRGSFATVLPATDVKTGVEVALKIQSDTTAHIQELHALHGLRGVAYVVELMGFFPCQEGFVLVLRRLVPVRYDTMRGSCDSSVESLWKFSRDALSALCAIHAAGWAHCDIKPSAIMMNAETKQCVYSDFNLARHASTAINRHKGLPGTAGWVFDESPVSTAAEVDRVGLGAVFGWLLDLGEFGDPDSNYADAVRGLQRQLRQRQRKFGGSFVKAIATPRERLLRVVEEMMQLPDPSCPLQSLLETMTKEDHRSQFNKKNVAFPAEKENRIVANPSLTQQELL